METEQLIGEVGDSASVDLEGVDGSFVAVDDGGSANVRRRATTRRDSGSGGGDDHRYGRFECNICLDNVSEPVVTRCGHLFCWPCLYRWLHSSHTDCPVCKAGVSTDTVIPLYGRGHEQVDPRTKPASRTAGGSDVPERPPAERLQADRPRSGANGGGTGWPAGTGQFGGANVTLTPGFGFFPSLFGLQFQTFTGTGPGQNPSGAAGGSTAEEAQQAFLSRVLLLLGMFVVLCLLLF